jgi:hypothetical protein
MPLIKTINQGVAANAIITPWAGNQYEILPFDAEVFVALLADAGDVWNASVFSGSDVLLVNSQIDQLAIATPITFPDDYSLSDLAAATERMGCQLTNLTGAVADVRTALKIDPL